MHTYSICKCNKLFGEETLHPLVSVVDLGTPHDEENLPLDCYAIVLATQPVGKGFYGHTDCDYSDAAMLFRLPDSTFDTALGRRGTMLLFHPDLIRCTCLGHEIQDCTFFHYNATEALHLSACEKRKVMCCISDIDEELHYGVDEFTKTILCDKIGVLLSYVRRFYHRQFIVRHDINAEHLRHIEALIDQYFLNGKAAKGHLPKTHTLATELHMTDYYLNDLVRHETGVDVGEYVSQRRIMLAKTQLLGTDKIEEEIASILGFCSPSYFHILFKKLTGCEPSIYRGR